MEEEEKPIVYVRVAESGSVVAKFSGVDLVIDSPYGRNVYGPGRYWITAALARTVLIVQLGENPPKHLFFYTT